MAVTKAKKAEQIEKLNQDLQKASSMIVGTFSKLTVSKDFELRKTVRTAGGK
jgi:large subunit ribosomal protein L10